MISTEKLPVPPVLGGAIQTYIAAVAPLLARSHDLIVLGVEAPQHLPATERRDGVTYVRVPGRSLAVYRDEVIRFLTQTSFDLIHIFNRPRLVLPVRQAQPDATLVLSLHNDMFDDLKIAPSEAQAALRELAAITTVSHYVGERVRSLYPEAGEKLHTIYSAVDVHRFAPAWSDQAKGIRQQLRAEHGLGKSPVILFVGRLSPKKGAHILVHAMPAVVKKHPDAALVLVGSKWYGQDHVSDYVAYLRALAAQSPARVITTGFVPPDQVHQWFWVGDLLACASLWQEPLARVHYEAMAAGLPIITSARGGNPEVVRGLGNGMVIEEPDDPAALAAAISSLLGDPRGRREMGRRGRSLAEERFTWDRVARELLSVWAQAPP